ncbi:MAG: cytochrome C [Betaproteobacteria bacterium]|nr:cytochrome C [Betaproteobacteria bacterium]
MRGTLKGAVIVGLLAGSAAAGGAELPNLERGRALYENHCVVCHTSRVHGRIPALAINTEELRRIVANWAAAENLRWNEQDVTDVVHFLRQTRYRF